MLTRTTAFPHITFTAADLERFAEVTARLKLTGDAGAYDEVRLPKWGIVTVWADGDVTIMGAPLLRPLSATDAAALELTRHLGDRIANWGN